MSMQRLLLAVATVAVLSVAAARSKAQVNDRTSRDEIRNAVRLRLHLKRDHFLIVQRDESLEQKLTIARGKAGILLYRLNQAGDEIKGDAVVHHIFTDSDPTYIVAVRADGSMYCIHGFSDSGPEFEKLMTAARMNVSTPEEAELVAEFYRDVNPANQPLARISNLLEFKQAAERQCQTANFDESERAFDAWWSRAKSLYAAAQFEQIGTRSRGGYVVEWMVLSSPVPGMCAGAPVRARLDVSSDGHVGLLTFRPF